MKFNLKHVQALDLRFDSDAGNDLSIRDYFFTLLKTLWEEGEGFSGKRPFGNSGWEFEIYQVLIKNKLVPGTLDSDGYINDFDADKMYSFVSSMLEATFYGK